MIVITAPTGQIGSRVLVKLLDGEEPLRVIIRDPDRLPAGARDRVEVVRGSHGDVAIVEEAFAGADAVFWLVPADPRARDVDEAYSGFARPAIDGFARHGVRHVVGISALGRGTALGAHAGNVTATHRMDDLIAATGVAYRALTMPSFMDNILRQVQPIAARGVFFGVISGDRRMPSCATEDIATVAAGLLRDRSWVGVADVPVLGPEDLSFDDMAATMSDVLGREVHYQQLPGEAFKENMVNAGMSGPMAQALLDMAEAKDAGLDNAEPRTPEATTPSTFRHWCETVLRPAVRDATASGS